MKNLIPKSVFILISVSLLTKSYAQKTNPAIIENVSESYAEEMNLFKTPPHAVFSFTPTSGSTSTFIEFDGSESYDDETLTSDLKIRWDWENDGKWDKTWSTQKQAQHKYLSNGIFTVKMEVVDADGSTDDTTMQLIIENFNPCPELASIDYMGQKYNTVLIGDQCWLRENLNVGKMIRGFEKMRNDGNIEKYCYDNDPLNCKTFGGLYQWDELMQYTPKDSTGICPEGWHVPTEKNLDVLTKYLGGENIAGEKLKEAGALYWESPQTNITNKSGFAALPGGMGGGDNTFSKMGVAAYFATIKHNPSLDDFIARAVNPYGNKPIEITYTKDTSYNMVLTKDSHNVGFEKSASYKGVSVRCIKTKTKDEPQVPVAKFYYHHPFPKPLKKPTYQTFRFNPFSSHDNQDPDSSLLVSWNWNWKNNRHAYSGFNKMKVIEKLLEQDSTYIVKLIVMDSDGNRDTTTHRITVEKNTPPHAVTPYRKWDCGDTSTWFPFTAMFSWDNEYCRDLLKCEWNYDVDNLDPTGGITKDRTWGPPPYNWSTRHKYSKTGIYTVWLVVTDPEGLTDTSFCTAKVCDPKLPPPKNRSPKACFTVYPKSGTTCDEFQFDASCSSDFEDPIDSLKFCWFFDWGKHRKYPDKVWNKENKIVKHKYPFADEGIGYSIRLGVMDTKGKQRFIIRDHLTVAKCEAPLAKIPPDTINQKITVYPEPKKPDIAVGQGTEYTPPTTNCPKKEYLIFFPFNNKGSLDSLHKITSQGYKLIAGSFALFYFEREENSSAIYPIKMVGKTDIEQINKLAEDNWVVVNSFFLTYLIQDKSAPHYEYKYGDDLSNYSMHDYKSFLPGGENLRTFNDFYGTEGWEIVDILGNKTLFRRIKGSTVKYKYRSVIFTDKDKKEHYKVLQDLGKKGWQYCSRPHTLKGQTGEWPVILKQRVGMGDAFSYQLVVIEDPDAHLPVYMNIVGKPEKEKQMVKAYQPFIWNLNNFGQAGWAYEMFVESYGVAGTDMIVIVFQVPAGCR